MPDTKTPEEILRDFYEPETQSEKDGILLAMKEYASQQSRATAIGFAEWLNAHFYMDDTIQDLWFDPAGQSYSSIQAFEKYLQSLTNQNKEG